MGYREDWCVGCAHLVSPACELGDNDFVLGKAVGTRITPSQMTKALHSLSPNKDSISEHHVLVHVSQ